MPLPAIGVGVEILTCLNSIGGVPSLGPFGHGYAASPASTKPGRSASCARSNPASPVTIGRMTVRGGSLSTPNSLGASLVSSSALSIPPLFSRLLDVGQHPQGPPSDLRRQSTRHEVALNRAIGNGPVPRNGRVPLGGETSIHRPAMAPWRRVRRRSWERHCHVCCVVGGPVSLPSDRVDRGGWEHGKERI